MSKTESKAKKKKAAAAAADTTAAAAFAVEWMGGKGTKTDEEKSISSRGSDRLKTEDEIDPLRVKGWHDGVHPEFRELTKTCKVRK